MAERRMFAKTLIDSDLFLDMPATTQCLYFHLSMRADDDGFINNPKKIQRIVGSRDDDLKLLIAKNFIIPFESGVVVIKHWKIHNYIRSDRYKETLYLEEKSKLSVGENKEYILGIPDGIPTVSKRETQARLGKARLGKVSLEQQLNKEKSTVVVDKIKEYFDLDEKDLKKVINAFLSSKKDLAYLVEKLELTKNSDGINNSTAYLIAALKNDYKISINKNVKNSTKKTGFHNFDESFDKYSDAEFDEIIKKSQKEKFG